MTQVVSGEPSSPERSVAAAAPEAARLAGRRAPGAGRRVEWAVLLATCGLYLATWAALPAGVFFSPDEGGRFLQMQATSWGEGADLDRAYGARLLDPYFEFFPQPLPAGHTWHELSLSSPRPQVGGGVEFNWSPLFPLLSKPLYAMFGARALRLLPLAAGLAVVVLAGAVARRVGAGGTGVLLALVGVGVATPIVFYSQLFWEHTLATACALGALLLVLAGRRSRRHWSGALVLSALSVHLRHELALFVVALAVALVWCERRAAAGWLRRHWRRVAGAAIAAVLLGALFASPVLSRLEPSRSERVIGEKALELLLAARFWTSLPERLAEVLVGGVMPSSPHVPRPLGYAALAGFALALFAARSRRHRLMVAGLVPVLVASAWTIADPSRFRLVHALLLPMPALALGWCFAAGSRAESDRDPARIFAALFAVYAALGTLAFLPLLFGGLEWGNRYLLTLSAFGAIGAGVMVEKGWRRARAGAPPVAARAVAALWLCATLLGALFQLRGLRELAASTGDLDQYRTAVESSEGATVTDLYWLSGALAQQLAARPLLTVREPAQLAEVLGLRGGVLRRVQVATTIRDLADLETWLAAARSRGFELVGDRNVAGLRFLDFEDPARADPRRGPATEPSL
jgi:hypothetical protein